MIFCIYEHISQKRSCLNFASQERQPSPRNEKKEPNRFQCEIGPISFFLGALLGRLFGEVYRFGTNLFVLFFCFFFVDADRRPAKWRVTPLGTDPKWRIDQRIRTEKSFPVSPFRFHCQRKSFRSIRFRITVSNEGEKKKLTRLVM